MCLSKRSFPILVGLKIDFKHFLNEIFNLNYFSPVFTVDQILRAAESNETEIQLMLTKGGVVQIMIDWYCNYDIFWDKQCVPSYSFRRFDLPFSDISSAVSSGFNFR